MAKHLLSTFLLGVLAGVFIAAGGSINLQMISMGQPILGGIFFPVGLLSVCYLGAALFTGKVGYALENKPPYLLDLLIMLSGNCIGAMAIGYAAGFLFKDWTVGLVDKLAYGGDSNFWNCFLRALAAGGFVYIAVESFKKIPSHPVKVVMIVGSIACMVLLGCNHSIANVFYFSFAQIRVAGFDGGNAVVSVIVAIVGNALGSLILYVLQKGIVCLRKPKEEAK